MAGIEQIVIHSKSYLVRWVQVPEYHSISWSVQPHKKSINFGIFKHPGTKNGVSPNLPTQETVETAGLAPPFLGDTGRKSSTASRRMSVSISNVIEKLHTVGIVSVAWTGRCEPDIVSMGRYDVVEGEGGTYGLVFDNTFSKQTSKNVTLVLMTHLTNAPPKSGHHLHLSQAFADGSSTSVGKSTSPTRYPTSDSTESLPQSAALHRTVLEDPRPPSKAGHAVESKGIEGTTFYTGVLSKKRRKKGQGFAKRYFSLDFTSSTLSYYRDRHSSALRGAVPLSLAAIGANEKTREFSIDSGAEVWHLKASNKKDFEGWKDALERASGAASAGTPVMGVNAAADFLPSRAWDPQEAWEWERVEQLVSQVSGTRDAVRGLAKDTDPKYLTTTRSNGLAVPVSPSSSATSSPTTQEPQSYFPEMDDQEAPRRSFWKRKPSQERGTAALMRRSVSAQLAVPSPSLAGTSSSASAGPFAVRKRPSVTSQTTLPDTDVHGRCMALLRDLDNVVADFSALIAQSKARRIPPVQLPQTTSRLSIDTIDSQEFFDAEDGEKSPSQLLTIRQSSVNAAQEDQSSGHASDGESDVSSEIGDSALGSVTFHGARKHSASGLFPSAPQSLPPLPISPVQRRATISPPRQSPPSIIGFLKKNAGKDLSTVSMPVTANEPTSLLQRLAESVEYSHLLDSAASASITSAERLMYVAAFAVSYFSNNRVKERAIRKPFNPMLGETYELVREDLGFRFLAEKVSHHPVRMACQAESLTNGGWCYTQSPQPVQKFWGKSVELNTEGRARVFLHAPNEYFSWSQATCFLRNVIAGEKYVEPVQTMTIRNETTGMRAVVTFKSGGMFSGRSEEVNVQLFDAAAASPDVPLPLGLTGKWTDSLKRTDTGDVVWKVGALVPDAPKTYGFTAFAAALNEVTEIEANHLPPTDSRLRPDQQALEVGDTDKAEGLKARLEERQRGRRKVRESHGQPWTPQFFDKVAAGVDGAESGEDEIWMLKQAGGYWDRRAKGDWSGVEEVFEY